MGLSQKCLGSGHGKQLLTVWSISFWGQPTYLKLHSQQLITSHSIHIKPISPPLALVNILGPTPLLGNTTKILGIRGPSSQAPQAILSSTWFNKTTVAGDIYLGSHFIEASRHNMDSHQKAPEKSWFCVVWQVTGHRKKGNTSSTELLWAVDPTQCSPVYPIHLL